MSSTRQAVHFGQPWPSCCWDWGIRAPLPADKRASEAFRLRVKYPSRVPVIVERLSNSDAPELDRNKSAGWAGLGRPSPLRQSLQRPSDRFLVPCNMLVTEFQFVVRRRVQQLAQAQAQGATVPTTALYFLCGDGRWAPRGSATMGEVHEQYRDADGFLYIQYATEVVFGA